MQQHKDFLACMIRRVVVMKENYWASRAGGILSGGFGIQRERGRANYTHSKGWSNGSSPTSSSQGSLRPGVQDPESMPLRSDKVNSALEYTRRNDWRLG